MPSSWDQYKYGSVLRKQGETIMFIAWQSKDGRPVRWPPGDTIVGIRLKNLTKSSYHVDGAVGLYQPTGWTVIEWTEVE